MTILTAHTPFNNGLYAGISSSAKGELVSHSNSQLVISLGSHRFVFLGHFEYNNADKLTSGNFTGLQDFIGPTLQWEMSHISLTLQKMVDFAYSSNPGGLVDYIMRNPDEINGSAFGDKLFGLGGGDNVRGNGGNDSLFGGSGNDLLSGGTGKDLLGGGDGADHFRFSSPLNSNTNVDTIKDFATARGDVIELSDSVFKKLSDGDLSVNRFKANGSGNATDSNDYILYETDTGALYYDADGNGAGAKVKFALIGAHLDLSAADFMVV